MPEEYGGLDLDKASSLAVVERIGPSASFATTFGGQANLCILPLVLFGTPEQKQKYLPRLITGETDRRLRAERIGLGIGCAGGEDASDEASGRKLVAQRREDVDQQRRLRRSLHHLREG